MKVEARQLQLNQRFTEVIDTVRHQRHGRRGGWEYEQTKEAFL
jgi:Leu/Phe-tRNA-protein transferase